jgi:ketosteroid isomerase-like protein
MEKSQEEEIRRFYRAFNARDIDAVLDRLAEDVVWANGIEGGHVEGHPAVRQYWRRQFEMIQPHFEPKEIKLTDDGRIAVEVHQDVRSLDGDLLADQRVTHLYNFDGDTIWRFDIAE